MLGLGVGKGLLTDMPDIGLSREAISLFEPLAGKEDMEALWGRKACCGGDETRLGGA